MDCGQLFCRVICLAHLCEEGGPTQSLLQNHLKSELHSLMSWSSGNYIEDTPNLTRALLNLAKTIADIASMFSDFMNVGTNCNPSDYKATLLRSLEKIFGASSHIFHSQKSCTNQMTLKRNNSQVILPSMVVGHSIARYPSTNSVNTASDYYEDAEAAVNVSADVISSGCLYFRKASEVAATVLMPSIPMSYSDPEHMLMTQPKVKETTSIHSINCSTPRSVSLTTIPTHVGSSVYRDSTPEEWAARLTFLVSKVINFVDNKEKQEWLLSRFISSCGWSVTSASFAPTTFHAEHRYMVMGPPQSDLLVVDLNFKDLFDIARPTKRYRNIFLAAQTAFIGTFQDLHHVIEFMCIQANRSLQQQQLERAPWRQANYLQELYNTHNLVSDQPKLDTPTSVELMKRFMATHGTLLARLSLIPSYGQNTISNAVNFSPPVPFDKQKSTDDTEIATSELSKQLRH